MNQGEETGPSRTETPPHSGDRDLTGRVLDNQNVNINVVLDDMKERAYHRNSELAHSKDRTRPKIPEAGPENFASSSETAFGQNTISMVDEFIEKEHYQDIEKKGFFRKLFFCC